MSAYKGRFFSAFIGFILFYLVVWQFEIILVLRLILLLILLPFIVSSKGNNEAILDISAGAGSGWWVYNKGSTNGTQKNHLGYDHTRTAGIASFEADLFYKRNRWKIGGGFEFSLLIEDEMRATEHRYFDQKEYPIAEKYVRFYKFNFLTSYDLFVGRRFTLSPQLKLGSFLIDTTHPASENFGFRMHWSFGLINQIALAKRTFLILQPFYSALTIWPKDDINKDEKHNIYSFGVLAGFRFQLTKIRADE